MSRFSIKILGISIETEIFEILSISKVCDYRIPYMPLKDFAKYYVWDIPFIGTMSCSFKTTKKCSEKQKDKKLLQKQNITHLIKDFLGKKGSIKT